LDRIYLDHAATTPLRGEVRSVMEPFLGERFGNPSSVHRWGRRASAALEEARTRIADALGARPGEIRFVRGGTEGANLAVLGRVLSALGPGLRPGVVASAVEHRAVLETLETVRRLGGEGHLLPLDPRGVPDPGSLEAALASGPAVLSLMLVNNETGIIHPVPSVAGSCRAARVVVHTDAVQAVGRIPVDLRELPVDLLTLSGHKLGGPGGTGVLAIREGVPLEPWLRGGGQEGGIRPGTEDVVGAVGLAEAVVLAVAEQDAEARRLEGLRAELESRLREVIPDLRVHGEDAPRAPHILHLGIPGVDPHLLVPALDLEGVGASRGSACSSGASRTSHVLEALYGPMYAAEVAPLRLSLGRTTTAAEVAEAGERVAGVVSRLRRAHKEAT
jgi:cysteine desulfurase